MIAQPLQRGESCRWYGGGLFETNIRGFGGNGLAHADVFSQGAVAATVDLVAGFEVFDLSANTFNNPCIIAADPRVFGFPPTAAGASDDDSFHAVPVSGVH